MFKFERTLPQILALLKKSSPLSTGFIAKKLKISYATSQRALFELFQGGRVKTEKISGRVFWWYKK